MPSPPPAGTRSWRAAEYTLDVPSGGKVLFEAMIDHNDLGSGVVAIRPRQARPAITP